jgi:riboflavin synthase
MFTGIVEEIGHVHSILQKGHTLLLSIKGSKVLEDIHIGDSIAVNGVCLTVTTFHDQLFLVDVMPETFKSTSLAKLQPGSPVNLERAIAAGGRFGGHFVTGHVDCTGMIRKKVLTEQAIYLDIDYPDTFRHLLLKKGSIAIDGTSLTVFDVSRHQFTVSLIPHTAQQSVIGKKCVGDTVNLEFDLIGKYLYSFQTGSKQLEKKENPKISMELLKENGFL